MSLHCLEKTWKQLNKVLHACASKSALKTFPKTELSRIFTCFWQLGDKNIQDAYIHGLIRVRKIERHRPRRSHYTPRSVTFVYVVRFALLCFCLFSTFHPFDCLNLHLYMYDIE